MTRTLPVKILPDSVSPRIYRPDPSKDTPEAKQIGLLRVQGGSQLAACAFAGNEAQLSRASERRCRRLFLPSVTHARGITFVVEPRVARVRWN